MDYIVTHYESNNGDFSPTVIECFDTYEGYKYVAKRFNLGEPDAIPLAQDLTAIFSFFISSDKYDEWKIIRAIVSQNGSYENGHYENKLIEIENEEGQITEVEENVWIVDEIIPTLSLALTYRNGSLEGSIKKERVNSKDIPPIESNLVSAWNTLSSQVEAIKNAKKIEDQEKRALIDNA